MSLVQSGSNSEHPQRVEVKIATLRRAQAWSSARKCLLYVGSHCWRRYRSWSGQHRTSQTSTCSSRPSGAVLVHVVVLIATRPEMHFCRRSATNVSLWAMLAPRQAQRCLAASQLLIETNKQGDGHLQESMSSHQPLVKTKWRLPSATCSSVRLSSISHIACATSSMSNPGS